jgi:DNA topoisomerase I
MTAPRFDCDTTGRVGDADHSRIAADAGLLYLPVERPGIRRRRRGRGFSYTRDIGGPVGADERARLAALAIPPAWTDVWIAPEPLAHVQAVGVDQAGRRQYRYHPDWRVAADVAKFERLGQFAKPLARLRQQVDRDLRQRTEDWACAALVRLIDDSLIRPGHMRHLRTTGSIGATTLQAEHVDVTRSKISLRFAGKSAVDHEIEIRDSLLARRLSDLLDEAGPGDPIFSDDDGAPVDSGELNRYLARHAGEEYTAKDLRTWGATSAVAERLATTRLGDHDDDVDAIVSAAIEHAAERLGNTVQVCRTAYVSPSIIERYRDGTLAQTWKVSRSTVWLSRAEQTVRRTLEAE